MFSAVVSSVNGSTLNDTNNIINNINKRSKVCDADSNGNVNVNCRR